jgi:pimeloyl-ACP methyl ester carboxylesterase
MDAPPIDRLLFPKLNVPTEVMINKAFALGDLCYLGLEGARKHIEKSIEDPQLRQALQLNLNGDATWACNMRAIHNNKSEIFTYRDYGTYYGPTLFINGELSYQRPIQDHISFYRIAFPNAKESDLIEVEGAGHGVHFDQPMVVGRLLHQFLLSNL